MRQLIFSTVHSRAIREKVGGIAGPIVFLFIAIAVLAIFYFASFSKGSRDVFVESQEIQQDPVAAEKMLAESHSTESQFNSIHEFKKNQITEEDVDIYEKSVECYGKYLAHAGLATSYNPRLEQMRKRLHELRADSLRKRSSQLEIQAEDLATEKKYSEAETFFSSAAALEFRITREFPLASKKNHARANFLENRARTMRVIPLQLRSKQLESEGVAALDSANWPKANACLSEALSIEKELWLNYRNIIASSDIGLRRLQDLLATVNSAPDYERRERYIAEARAEEEKSNWEGAAKKWADAHSIQKSIVQNFPHSFYATESTEKELARNVANAMARPLFLELQKNYAEMQMHIRSHMPDRVPLIAKQALRNAEKILRDCPESTLVSEDFLQELRYMDIKASDISSVQASFINLLIPIPGTSNRTQMMKTEVSQALYTFVMPYNPSAKKDLSSPVESVDFNDAKEFCRKLSLLIGCTVRLPTQSEFLAAAGISDTTNLLTQAWLIENSSGIVHTGGKRIANANGFFDLYGNVSEWIIADDENAKNLKNYEALIAGGDCQTPAYALMENCFQKVTCSKKSRTCGFRVVAELDFKRQ